MQKSRPVSLRKLVLLAALQLSTVWDLITTLLGILLILDSRNLVAISLAVIGTLIVVAFNFSTRPIWQRRQRYSSFGLPLLGLRLVWLMAVAVDLWTSLTCNAWFIGAQGSTSSIALPDLLGRLSLGQLIIVVFITLVSGVSPMLVGYLRDQDIDSLLN
ncbi:hypothetical protein VB780_21085 [Leptolyngbya sp. CCNP1308]|uniref:hypothetical protein n=1 Tax=Leptolyngbya sp. CCNP1308 TaxID=3110255 RepID=UPI002B21C5EE|nr:hypothetical protein [Leptolyngbya sp. CCNP1308]MEA5451087.1 hypothetical protein [Leptolyngbya sp. CCNP1308]